MKGIAHCRTLASLIMLIILVLFPGKSWSTDETYKSQREASGNAILKRRHAIDYDSFMGLMGRRSAAPARGNIDHILADLLRQKTTGAAFPSAQRNFLKRGGRFINHGGPRIQGSPRNGNSTHPPMSSAVL